jgi:hypothetical protein
MSCNVNAHLKTLQGIRKIHGKDKYNNRNEHINGTKHPGANKEETEVRMNKANVNNECK